MNPSPSFHVSYPSTDGEPYRVSGSDPLAAEKISSTLTAMIHKREEHRRNTQRLILCIGSDRSTGDSLGPLVGSRLSQLPLPRTLIWGTLAQPVHALNLAGCIRKIEEEKNPPLVVAVDASLGKPGSIGLIEVGGGPVYPGAGVNKQLPPVGHFHISGIVNLGGFMEQMVLQSTRLYYVMEMAEVIAAGLRHTLSEV